MTVSSAKPDRRIDATYQQARTRFLAAAERAGARMASHAHPLLGLEGESLGIDVAQLGAEDAPAVVVIVSATHGVEGYAGSALQCWWLDERAASVPEGVRVVLVHALNPFGFSWVRRVNEDNVDLNRNFIDWSAPPRNDGYEEIADLLVPAEWTAEAQAAANTALGGFLKQQGMERFHEIVASGQYNHPTGLFYGGTEATWSNQWLQHNLAQLVGPAAELGVVDIHTGLGEWGTSQLILPGSTGSALHGRATDWWGEVHSLVDGESVSSVVNGDWLSSVDATVPDVEATYIALEYGTVDPIAVLAALRADAWLHGHGDPLGSEAPAIRQQVRGAFCDDDPAWLAAITPRFDEVAGAALAALSRPMRETTVVHNQVDDFDIYIGREVPEFGLPASKWGNPFVMADESDLERARAIDEYRAWVQQQPELMGSLGELRGKRLACWCAPKPCHGHVLVELINNTPR